MTTPITCPACGHPGARRYDYDTNGQPGSFSGYCAQCKRNNGSSGQMRMRQEGDHWIATWTAPPTTRYAGGRRCTWCDESIHYNNKSGYCQQCRTDYAPRYVGFAICQYRNCRRWFTHRRNQHRVYCTNECGRSETNRQAQERTANGKRPRRRNIKTNLRYEVAYRHGYRCSRCRKLLNLVAAPTATNAMQIDHIIEVADGGTDDAANLRPLCVPCHQARRMGDTVQLRIA